MQTISASDLKARCLAVLDEVNRTGEPVTVTKRGRPVAQLVPAPLVDATGDLAGSVEILGDIVSPALPPDDWEAEDARR
jgi:prevent-host-death family protein